MWIVYEQDYDCVTMKSVFDNEIDAKDYSELIGAVYEKVESVPRPVWPKKIEYSICTAGIDYYHHGIYKSYKSQTILDTYFTKDFLGFNYSTNYISYTTLDPLDKATEDFDNIMNGYKVINRPTKYGTIQSEFVKC